MLLTRKLRNQPITAVRFIRAVKYFFAEHIKMPHDVEWQQVSAIHQDILKPLLGSTELKGAGISPGFIQNLLRSMAGLRVHELHPWLLSSAYIFVYFVISRHKNDSICMEAYDYMLKGETPTFEAIEHVVNDIIFKCGNLNETNSENCKGLAQNQIRNFRKTLQRDCCQNELQVLVAWPEDLGLICSSDERGNMENEMLHYFKLFEVNYTTADGVNNLNYLENKDTEESSANNFSNSIEDNSTLTSLKQSKSIGKNLENCNLQDENQVETITKRILRPRIKVNNELHKKDEIEGRITRSKSKIILIDLDVVDKESQDNSKKVIESNDVVNEHEFSCRRIMPFVGKTLRKPLYGGPERPIEINYSIDTPELDLINDTMQLDIETSSVILNDVDIEMQERNNELQDVLVNEENEIDKSVVSSKDINEKSNYSSNVNKSLDSSNHKEKLQSVSTTKALFNANADISIKDSSNITKSSLNNENVRAEVNFTAELLKKNSKPEPVSQDVKEKADIVKSDSNNILCSLNSSTKKDEVSINLSSANLKSNNNTPNNESHVISINDTSRYQSITNKNKFPNTSGTSADLIINPIQLEEVSNSEISKEIDKVKQKNSNKIQDILEKKENKLVKPVTDSVSNENKTCFVNENSRARINLISELSNKNRKSESISQDSKEKADTSFNVIDTNLVSSKDINRKSSKQYDKSHGTLWKQKLANYIKMYISCNSLHTIATNPNILAPTTAMDNEKRDSHSNSNQATQANQNNLETDHLIGQSQDPQIEQKTIKNSLKFNSSAIDSRVFTATNSNFTASNNNSGSTSKKASNTMVDLEFEQSILNSQMMNQLPQNPSHAQSRSVDSSSNSSIMDISISAASTSKLTASSTLKRESIAEEDLDFEPTMLNLKRTNQSPQELLPTMKKMCFESRSNSCATNFPIPVASTSSNLTASNNNSDSTLKRKSITVIDLDLEPCMLNSNATIKTEHPDTTFKTPEMDISNPASTTNSSFTAEYKDSSSYMKEVVTTKVENPDLEIVKIRKNNSFGRSISGMKMSSNTASMPTLTPGPLAILFANSDLSKNSKGNSAAAIDKTIPCNNGSPSDEKQSQPRRNAVDNFSRKSIPMDWQSKKASLNEPVNGLIFTTGQKATPTSLASLTEMNGVNPVEHDNPLQSQQYPLQDQQQPCLFASCPEVNDNTFSSSFNNDFSKFQSNIQQNIDMTNVGGNVSVQAGPLPLNPRLTTSTVSDRTSTIQLAEKNKIGSAYQEDILQSTLSTDMSTVGDQFPLNRADEDYSNTPSVKPRLLTKVRITPMQQPNIQFNGKRYPTHYSDVQHYNLVNNTPTLHNCLPAQQQHPSMGSVFHGAPAVARHDVNEVLTPASKVWQAPVNLDNLHYFCDYCPIQLKFESAELLYQHVNDAHNYSCQFCQNRYPTRQALLQHIDEHTGSTSAKQVIAVHSELCKLDLECSLIFGSE